MIDFTFDTPSEFINHNSQTINHTSNEKARMAEDKYRRQ